MKEIKCKIKKIINVDNITKLVLFFIILQPIFDILSFLNIIPYLPQSPHSSNHISYQENPISLPSGLSHSKELSANHFFSNVPAPLKLLQKNKHILLKI